MNGLYAFFRHFYQQFTQFTGELTTAKLISIVDIVFSLIVIYIFFAVIRKFVKKITVKHCSAQIQTIINKVIKYAAFVTIILTIFHRLGIDISAILGAAGIAGIAIGFAAQTSVSNVISGLFVLTERAFKIGDIIEVTGTVGTVQSIYLLSVVLQTFDNQYVRIPNEIIIKANLTNYSYFPIRRVKTDLLVAYGSDLKKVEEVLLSAARNNPFVLESPEPSILWRAFDSSGIGLTLRTWVKNEDFIRACNALFIEISERLTQEGIEIPFPQMDVHVKNTNAGTGL